MEGHLGSAPGTPSCDGNSRCPRGDSPARHGYRRDLKPGNVMLTETGREATRLRPGQAPGGSETSFFPTTRRTPGRPPGSIGATATAGTLCYMAPEQVRGDEIDHRADIFAFGALLWEMITGRKPSTRPRGRRPPRPFYTAHLRRSPTCRTGSRHSSSDAWKRIRSRRWQTAHEMVRALRATASLHGTSRASASRRLVALGIATAIAIAVLFLTTPAQRTGGGRPRRDINRARERDRRRWYRAAREQTIDPATTGAPANQTSGQSSCRKVPHGRQTPPAAERGPVNEPAQQVAAARRRLESPARPGSALTPTHCPKPCTHL